VQLLVDNRSDSTKMHGTTIRFTISNIYDEQICIGGNINLVRLFRMCGIRDSAETLANLIGSS